MVTIEDIAREAGVAKSTVSNVFSGKKYVSPEIVDKVMRICREHDYFPNFYASTLSNKKTANIIGVFFGERERGYLPYYNELLESILVESSKRGNNVLVYYGLDDSEVATRLKAGRSPIDAAILVSPSLGDERFSQLKKESIPFFVIGNPEIEDSAIYSIDNDNYGLVEKIAEGMIQNGHRKIALIDADKSLTICQDREKAFCEVLGKNGITSAQESIFNSKYSSVEDGYYYATRAIKEGYTGFIIANGFISKGVYEAMRDMDRKIGQDVEIFSLGYSYSEDLSYDPSLSFARQDYHEFGSKAASMLIDYVKEGKAPDRHRFLVPSQIHLHDSFSPKAK